MQRGTRIVWLGFLSGVVITLAVIAVVTKTGQPLYASPESLAALNAWSSYTSAAAAILLVLLAIVGGYEAQHEFRTSHRPVPDIGPVAFRADGVSFALHNNGPGTMVRVHVRLWVGFLGPAQPLPDALGALIENLAIYASTNKPMFEGDFQSLPPGGEADTMLRSGPAAGTYNPEWAGGWGVVVWEAAAIDLFGTAHAGSGYTIVEGLDVSLRIF
ncbi:MAG: hypothetical protein WC273_10355 [Dehalococcoidia bacterium]